jgi:hypothetical protein
MRRPYVLGRNINEKWITDAATVLVQSLNLGPIWQAI